MSLKAIDLHQDFPRCVWVIIEQPSNEPKRIEYDADQNEFRQTEYRSLIYERGFSGAYGWIGGLGTPPDKHSDVILISDRTHKPGDVVPAYVCGIFYRIDGDHKIVSIDAKKREAMMQIDLWSLAEDIYNEVTSIYPDVAENEGWYGAQEAQAYLQKIV